jgi:hypothetical protein
MSKYKNQKTTVDNITFDSKVESEYYKYLQKQQNFGYVRHFVLQPKWKLTEAYQLTGQKKKQAAMTYSADFLVFYTNGESKIIDIKGGPTTPDFKIKKKLFESKYLERIIEVRWQGGQWVES